MKTLNEYLQSGHLHKDEEDSVEMQIFNIVFTWCKNSIAIDYIPASRKDTWEFYKYSLYAVADAYDLFKNMYDEEPDIRKHFSNVDEFESYIKDETEYNKLAEKKVHAIYH